jgi:hypothetical protein
MLEQEIQELRRSGDRLSHELALAERQYVRDKSGQFAVGTDEYGGNKSRQQAQLMRKHQHKLIGKIKTSTGDLNQCLKEDKGNVQIDSATGNLVKKEGHKIPRERLGRYEKAIKALQSQSQEYYDLLMESGEHYTKLTPGEFATELFDAAAYTVNQPIRDIGDSIKSMFKPKKSK